MPPKVVIVLPADHGESTRRFTAQLSAPVVFNLAQLSANPPEFIVFMDERCDPTQLDRVLGPVVRNEVPIVMGSRRMRNTQMPLIVVGRNWLACLVIKLLTGKVYTDVCPFRALTWGAFQKVGAGRLGMQFKAPRNRLKVLEVPVDYQR